MMPAPPRFRPLRLVLAVLAALAFVASHMSIAQAAFGMPCTGVGPASAVGVATGAAEQSARHAAQSTAPQDAPPAPALAAPCASSIAALPPVTEIPTATTLWLASAPPLGPEARPVSHAPPPPFHPPRAI